MNDFVAALRDGRLSIHVLSAKEGVSRLLLNGLTAPQILHAVIGKRLEVRRTAAAAPPAQR